MATKKTSNTDTNGTDIAKKMAESAEYNRNELTKLRIYSRKNSGFTFYETILLGQRVTLDKALCDILAGTGKLKAVIELEPYMQLYATQSGKFCNFRLGISKEKREELNKQNAPADDGDDLPF